MSEVKIIIADDHATVRGGLKAALEVADNLKVIGEADDGLDAIDQCDDLEPDLVIMDLSMPKMDGIEATRRIKVRHPDTKVIMLTMFDNKEFVIDALSAGIDGYLLKMAKIDEVHKAIESVMRDEAYFDPQVTDMVSDYYSQMEDTEGEQNEPERIHVTSREREIISYLVKGYTTPEIAEVLLISPHTVNNHRANLLKKLNLKNTAEVIKFAIQRGWVN